MGGYLGTPAGGRRLLPYQPLVLTVRGSVAPPCVSAPRSTARRTTPRPGPAAGRGDGAGRTPAARAAASRGGLRLDEVELTPASYAEHLAHDQIVEELLDLVAERGYLTMSDLRNTIATG